MRACVWAGVYARVRVCMGTCIRARACARSVCVNACVRACGRTCVRACVCARAAPSTHRPRLPTGPEAPRRVALAVVESARRARLHVAQRGRSPGRPVESGERAAEAQQAAARLARHDEPDRVGCTTRAIVKLGCEKRS